MGLGALALLVCGLGLSSVTFAAGKKRPSDEDKGRELYDRHCYACHGTKARGDGPASKDLVKPVPDLTGNVPMDNVEALIEVVILGRGRMPGFEASLSRHDARRALRHTSRLANPEDNP